jgi:hypothetical protein
MKRFTPKQLTELIPSLVSIASDLGPTKLEQSLRFLAMNGGSLGLTPDQQCMIFDTAVVVSGMRKENG